MNWFIWLFAGILLALGELFTPGFFMVGIGVSAALTSIPVALGSPLWLALVIFALLCIAFFIFIRPLIQKKGSKETPVGVDALIGQSATVIESLDTQGNGRVNVKGEDWKARSESGNIEKGKDVRIVGHEGVTLIVKED